MLRISRSHNHLQDQFQFNQQQPVQLPLPFPSPPLIYLIVDRISHIVHTYAFIHRSLARGWSRKEDLRSTDLSIPESRRNAIRAAMKPTDKTVVAATVIVSSQ